MILFINYDGYIMYDAIVSNIMKKELHQNLHDMHYNSDNENGKF